MKAAGLDMLGVNAAELSAQRALTHEWTNWAMEAGSAGDKVKALFKDLQLEGANVMGGIFEGVHAAIEGLEKNLAQFIITGRRRDAIKIGVQFEEKVLTSMLHAAVGQAAGGLLHLFPSLKKIPGLGDIAKGKMGTRSNPMFVQSVDAQAALKAATPDMAGLAAGMGLPGVSKAIAGVAGGSGTAAKGGFGNIFGGVTAALSGIGGIFKGLFGGSGSSKAPTANATATPAQGAFKANLGKLAKFDEGFQPSQKKSGGLFSMLGGLASIGAMFIPGGQALSAGMMALKAGLAAAPIIGGGLDQLTGLAGGGDVTPGQAYVVGEKRPELFVPNAAGRIYPNVNVGKGTPSGETHLHITHNVQAMDSVGFGELLDRHSREVAGHITRVLRKENR